MNKYIIYNKEDCRASAEGKPKKSNGGNKLSHKEEKKE